MYHKADSKIVKFISQHGYTKKNKMTLYTAHVSLPVYLIRSAHNMWHEEIQTNYYYQNTRQCGVVYRNKKKQNKKHPYKQIQNTNMYQKCTIQGTKECQLVT